MTNRINVTTIVAAVYYHFLKSFIMNLVALKFLKTISLALVQLV